MHETGTTKVDLARLLGVSEGAVRRLLRFDHRSHIGRIEAALRQARQPPRAEAARGGLTPTAPPTLIGRRPRCARRSDRSQVGVRRLWQQKRRTREFLLAGARRLLRFPPHEERQRQSTPLQGRCAPPAGRGRAGDDGGPGRAGGFCPTGPAAGAYAADSRRRRGKPAPQQPPPRARPRRPELEMTERQFQDWMVRCGRQSQQGPEVCEMQQQQTDKRGPHRSWRSRSAPCRARPTSAC